MPNRVIRRPTERRRTTWARTNTVVSLAAANAYNTVGLVSNYVAAGGSMAGCTVLRSHILLSVLTATANGDQFAWGVYRGQTSDLGASIAGAPQPGTDFYEDWAYWNIETAGNGTPGAAVPVYGHWGGTNNLPLDLKAKRKIPELHMSWNLVIQRLVVASATLNVNIVTSVLLALP
jgi:hypothetical protein